MTTAFSLMSHMGEILTYAQEHAGSPLVVYLFMAFNYLALSPDFQNAQLNFIIQLW